MMSFYTTTYMQEHDTPSLSDFFLVTASFFFFLREVKMIFFWEATDIPIIADKVSPSSVRTCQFPFNILTEKTVKCIKMHWCLKEHFFLYVSNQGGNEIISEDVVQLRKLRIRET